jgi:hypothetical protein
MDHARINAAGFTNNAGRVRDQRHNNVAPPSNKVIEQLSREHWTAHEFSRQRSFSCNNPRLALGFAVFFMFASLAEAAQGNPPPSGDNRRQRRELERARAAAEKKAETSPNAALSQRQNQLQQFEQTCFTRSRTHYRSCANPNFGPVVAKSQRNAREQERNDQLELMEKCGSLPAEGTSSYDPINDPIRERVVKLIVHEKMQLLARVQQTRAAHNPQNYGNAFDIMEERILRFASRLNPDQFILVLTVNADGEDRTVFLITSYEALRKKMDGASGEQKAFFNKYFGHIFQLTKPFYPINMGGHSAQGLRHNELFRELILGVKKINMEGGSAQVNEFYSELFHKFIEVGDNEEANTSFICDPHQPVVACAVSQCTKEERELIRKWVIQSVQPFLWDLPSELKAGACENDLVNKKITDFFDSNDRFEEQETLRELVEGGDEYSEVGYRPPRGTL